MITCPQCGFAANDDAKFCDRCGQGLTRAVAPRPSLPPLKSGATLKGGLRIVELLGASSDENRYRATRSLGEGKSEWVQLRERRGPAVEAEASEEPPAPEESGERRARLRAWRKIPTARAPRPRSSNRSQPRSLQLRPPTRPRRTPAIQPDTLICVPMCVLRCLLKYLPPRAHMIRHNRRHPRARSRSS